MQKIKNFLKSKIGISIAVIIIIGIIYTIFFRSTSAESTDVVVERGDFEKVVSISGKVIPAESVDLSFETGGTVFQVYKKVGDKVKRGETVAALDSTDVRASREKAIADLAAAQAELDKLQNGEVSYSEVSINKQQVINTIVDAYTKSDDAVRNKVDQFFNDGRNQSPRIKYGFFGDTETKYKINEDRKIIEDALVAFEIFSSNLDINNYSEQSIKDAKTFILRVKSFLSDVSLAVNSFEVSVGLTQTSIDKYKSDVASGRSNVNAVLAELSSFEDKLQNSLSNIPVQRAKVLSAQATVRNYDAQISKTVISAPFGGVVSLQNAKVGESVSANKTVTTVISDNYQIEAYIPEVNISGILVGNRASVSLDAYGDEKFDATIIHIDPAETVRDGVSNYKIKLAFDASDSRILSGMTADVNIVTEKISNTIVIPERVTMVESDKVYVMKVVGDKTLKSYIVVGRKDGKGNIEVTEGLEVGDRVVLNPEK